MVVFFAACLRWAQKSLKWTGWKPSCSKTYPLKFSVLKVILDLVCAVCIFAVTYFGWQFIQMPFSNQNLIDGVVVARRVVPFFPWPDGPALPIVAGFLGWYAHSVLVLLRRVVIADVVTLSVFRRLLLRFITTLATSVMLLAVHDGVGAFFAFLLGFAPFSLWSLLDALGVKLGLKGSVFSNEERADLSKLPGISGGDVRRLEEEGIGTLAQLANQNPYLLEAYIPPLEFAVRQWIEFARNEVWWIHEDVEDVPETPPILVEEKK